MPVVFYKPRVVSKFPGGALICAGKYGIVDDPNDKVVACAYQDGYWKDPNFFVFPDDDLCYKLNSEWSERGWYYVKSDVGDCDCWIGCLQVVTNEEELAFIEIEMARQT